MAPGWRGRRAERSFQAQRTFLAAVERARAAYQPVREEIESRLEAYHAECQAAEYAHMLEKERRRQIMQDVAMQPMWRYSVEDTVISVHRAETADEDGPPLNAKRLDLELIDLMYRSPRRSREWEVEWDPDACAEVERECRERGADVTFATWWHEITNGDWETDTLPTGSTQIHIGTHSSHGNPGGGFDGGFSHGGHHGFGTTF